MFFSSSGRATRLAALAGGALACALTSAGPASAALGGATPANFTSSPNLVSVTADQANETAVFKFDRTVAAGTGCGLNVGCFILGGYSASQQSATPASVSIVGSGDSVLADFGGTDIDFNSLTYGAVDAGAVKGTITNSKDNFNDATRITNGTSVSGTTGHTAGPDLVSVTRNEDLEQITYTFDQAVDDTAGGTFPSPSLYGYVDVNGAQFFGDSVVNVSGNRVIIQFSGGDDVSDAVKAVIDYFNGPGFVGIADGYTANQEGVVFDSADVAGASGVAATPNLVSAEIDTNGGSVTFRFDKTIVSPVGDEGQFKVFLADGDFVTGTGTAQLLADAKSVRISFDLQFQNEFAVYAGIESGAVDGATNAVPSSADGAPLGGNAGAQASGYTTAPDAIQGLVNPAAGQASVLFDSRFFAGALPFAAGNFVLYTADGVSLGSPSDVSATAAAAPQQSRVVLTLTDTQATNAKNIVIDGQGFGGMCSVIGTVDLGGADSCNVVSALLLQPTSGTFKK